MLSYLLIGRWQLMSFVNVHHIRLESKMLCILNAVTLMFYVILILYFKTAFKILHFCIQ